MQLVAIDVETTGLNPGTDRVLEIAGIIYDLETGITLGEFETLINPMRNIPQQATDKHGLLAEHVSAAPTFQEFAPWLGNLLKGRVAVAHNSGFDYKFVSREFERAGIPFESENWQCTQKLSGGMSLSAACASYELDLANHHSALDDARACLNLFKMLGAPDSLQVSTDFGPEVLSFVPPITLTRSQVGIETKRMPVMAYSRRLHFPDLSGEFTYLAVVNEFLEDMRISDSENLELAELAKELGVSRERERELREEYLKAIEMSCMRDGIISQGEADLLNAFSRALGVKQDFVPKSESIGLPERGSLICVTGTATIDGVAWDKSKWKTKLGELGYRFTDDLRKSDGVSLLLQESEGSQSSKVAKALSWGIPRMTFQAFLNEIEG